MIFPKPIVFAVSGVLLASLTMNAHAQDLVFFPKAYVGVAAGQSSLEPQSSVLLDEKEDNAFKLFVGYDLSERSSVELHAADLGEATFANGASLGYQTLGMEYVYNLYASRGLDGLELRQGVIVFGKAGLGLLKNSERNIRVNREHDWHVSFGLGASTSLTKQTRLRMEFNAYDTDAHLLSLALVHRFSTIPAWPFRNQRQEAPSRPVIFTVPEPEPEPELETVTASDIDSDGVDDSKDLCPATPANRRVDESGCVFGGIVDGVQFELDSARLTLPAKARLDAIIQDMQRYPKLRVQITAHTDNQGDGDYNLQLSIKRAQSVADYLIEHGISPDRLRAIGAGESQPIYRNDSASGRQGNRRVDFKVLNY